MLKTLSVTLNSWISNMRVFSGEPDSTPIIKGLLHFIKTQNSLPLNRIVLNGLAKNKSNEG